MELDKSWEEKYFKKGEDPNYSYDLIIGTEMFQKRASDELTKLIKKAEQSRITLSNNGFRELSAYESERIRGLKNALKIIKELKA